ncbi:MAG TPA: hypothetical protein VL326_12220 [Kofleriaceae bacterium]|nr:hypothetical protein [Kofleriaceae bacterium]
MQRSRGALLVVAGAIGLFAILGVLVRAVHSEVPEAAGTHESAASQPGASQSGTPSSPSGAIAARDPSPQRKSIWKTPMMHVSQGDSDSAPSAPVVDENAPPATRGNTKNLQFGGTQLREQTNKVSHWVQMCVSDAKKKGLAPSGTAILTYVVAKHGDKYEVEDTGIDEDKTTLEGTELLDCLRTTAFAMHFEGLPREASGIIATRSVTLKDGVLTEYKHVGFSYLR